MFVPILMIAMTFGIASVINSAQETPATDLMAAEEATVEETPTEITAEEATIEAPADITKADEPKTARETEVATIEEPAPEISADIAEPQGTSAADMPTEPIVVSTDVSDEALTKSEVLTKADAPKVEEQETLIDDVSEELFAKKAEKEEEPAGIDTVSLENPQGNWLFKRIWWERAEERYEKIRILVDAIWESRNTFFKERNELDRKVLDPFYMSIGIDRGELQTILAEINDFLEKQREQQGDLSEQERVLYETYSTEEETLKQLKLDVDMITNLDHAIDDALGTFMNQINRVRNYESEAWKNFKEIAHILNDTKARELYYMIEGAARNIKTISTYLEQEFFTHFHKLIDEAKTRVARVQSQMDALKEKGVLFQKQAEQLEQQTAPAESEDEEEVVKPKPKLGWFDWISSGISDVLGYIWSVIRLPYDMVFGK